MLYLGNLFIEFSMSVEAVRTDKYVDRKTVAVVAMLEEAQIMASHLGLEHTPPPDKQQDGLYEPYHVFSNPNLPITLITTGSDPTFGMSDVGQIPATDATLEAMRRFQPELLMNAGTAGGVKPTESTQHPMNIGDIVVGTRITRHDTGFPEFFGPYFPYGTHYWELPDSAMFPGVEINQIRFLHGAVSSGERFNLIPHDLERLLTIAAQNNGVVAKDMEACAVVRTALRHRFQGQILVVKSITDYFDGDAGDFQRNFTVANRNLARTLEYVATGN